MILNHNNSQSSEKENHCGEIIETSLEQVKVALWPSQELEFGDIISFSAGSNEYLAIVFQVWQESQNSSRQIIPLQLSHQELRQTYPHLTSQLIHLAQAQVLSQPKKCATLHTWVKNIEQKSILKIVPALKLLELISDLEVPAKTKESLFFKQAQHFSQQVPSWSNKDQDLLYQLASKVFADDSKKTVAIFNH